MTARMISRQLSLSRNQIGDPESLRTQPHATCDRAVKAMRIGLLLLIILLAVGPLAFPTVRAAPPPALQRFPSAGKSSLEAGGNITFSWALGQDISEFLFYYDVTGDVVDVNINDTPYWPSLTGRGWRFCDGCQFGAGTYDVMVTAPFDAVQFYVAFYAVPQAPVDFAGFIPVGSSELGAD